ncbi:MAG: hydroxyacid dehydrogenase [Glaciihabitans sp.]|nr:hydroxyacid dehydrogenase [Glaciihabitans sp.]
MKRTAMPQISVAVIPESTPEIDAAISAAGARLAPLDDSTSVLVVAWGADKKKVVEAITAHPAIRLVQLPSAGVDAYAEVLTTTARPGLTFTSAKGAYSEPVAEHALALTLALLRSLPRRARATEWETTPRGISLYGLNITIIGAGGIALEFLRLVQPFRPQVTMVRRRAEPVAGVARTVTTDELPSTLPDADVVLIAAALTGGTDKLFGAAEFALMKPTAVLVNIARGGLVDTDALVTALADDVIGGAGLDVTVPEPLPTGHPLWDSPTAIITPHNADTPEMIAPLFADRLLENLRALAADNESALVGVVDLEHGY